MKHFLTLLFLNLFFNCAFSQTEAQEIKGVVIDTTADLSLANTSVSVLHARDSMLYEFTRSSEDGSFSIKNILPGDYILLMTYPKYADYVEEFKIDSGGSGYDFGRLSLILKSQLLGEVLVTGANAITIKGDTTEYNAGSYVIQPNSKVEDLLKQLPGIQVDKDGNITAQGETVKRVLVDGEEFFGDDPTLVTKNIRGDMVDKVQLYDRQSDQAAFTGVDDGDREKTINIKLKEGSKQGYFGKVDVGGGTDEFYQGQAMINAFKDKQKVAAFGNIGNTGKVGLGWQDNEKYGSASAMQFSDDGMVMYMGGGRDEFESFDGQYNGEGIPQALTGGGHYDAKWDEDKQSINGNYKIGSIGVAGNRSAIRINNLPTGVQNSQTAQTFDNHIFRQKLDAIYEIKLDTTSTLKFMVDGTLKNADTDNQYSEQITDSLGLINQSQRSLVNNVKDRIFNANGLWTKKLKKPGRTLSINLNQSINQQNSDGNLYNLTSFRDTTGSMRDSITDQTKQNVINTSIFRSNATYTEPILKDLSLVVNYGFTYNNGTADRRSFNRDAAGNYTELDSLFSNNFELNQTIHQAGAILNYKKGKTTVNVGTKANDIRFTQTDLYNDQDFNQHFLFLNPQATFQYRFSQQRSIRLNYSGTNQQPTIDQMQPVRVNTDPNNIVLGNPELEPSFVNRIYVNYNSYKVLSGQHISIYGNYGLTNNPIISNTFTDSLGRTTFQFNNLENRRPSNFYGGLSYGRKIKKIDLNLGGNLSTNGNVFYNMVNGEEGKTNAYSVRFSLNASKYREGKYEFWMYGGPSYNTNESTLQNAVNNNGWSIDGQGGFAIFLPLNFEIRSDASYQYNQATQAFADPFERVIVNASIAKMFLKEKNLQFRVGVNDLLNQNVGFNRQPSPNIFVENRYTTIRRYFLFSVIWDFNKMGINN